MSRVALSFRMASESGDGLTAYVDKYKEWADEDKQRRDKKVRARGGL